MRPFRSDSPDGWETAAMLLETYLKRPRKWEALIDRLPKKLIAAERKRCQFLLLGVIRNMSLIDWAIERTVPRNPRPRLKSILFLSLAEILLDREGRHRQVVDAAVERSKAMVSARESGFVNAVLRRAAGLLEEETVRANTLDDAAFRATFFSHPQWLVERWRQRWGETTALQLLRWNQAPAPVYLRTPSGLPPVTGSDWAETRWPGYFRWTGQDWRLVQKILDGGQGYVADPSTARPVELLNPRSGESVLDLCASPGGKSCAIREKLGRESGSRLVSVDLPGRRCERLRDNLQRRGGAEVQVYAGDLLNFTGGDLLESGLPERYSAVLLDAPCSNTGVLRRRPDAKWRLHEVDVPESASLQLSLLLKAAEFTEAGGRLVYATCSLEAEENDGVVVGFLKTAGTRFQLLDARHYHPITDGHDGGSAFLFSRSLVRI